MKTRQTGLSYIEVLVATLLIVVALVPMMESLGPGLQGAAIHRQNAEVHYALAGKLEAVLSESFMNLDAAATTAGAHDAPTAFSDLGAPVPHQVFIWRYDVDDADNDGDVFTGGEDDLLWIQVETQDGHQALQSLLSQY